MTYESELYHHGVKGQRWGVRRYQNADGTYTDEGAANRQKWMEYTARKHSSDPKLAKSAKAYYKANKKAIRKADRLLFRNAMLSDRVRNYQDKGMTYAEANEKVEKDLKKAKIAAGAAVAAIGGYALYKNRGKITDLIKTGKQLTSSNQQTRNKSPLDTVDNDALNNIAGLKSQKQRAPKSDSHLPQPLRAKGSVSAKEYERLKRDAPAAIARDRAERAARQAERQREELEAWKERQRRAAAKKEWLNTMPRHIINDDFAAERFDEWYKKNKK